MLCGGSWSGGPQRILGDGGVHNEKEASQREGKKQQRFGPEQLLHFPKGLKKLVPKSLGE